MRISVFRLGVRGSVVAAALVAALSFGAPIAWADNVASAEANPEAKVSVSAESVKTNASGAEQQNTSAQSKQGTEDSSKATTEGKEGKSAPVPVLNPGWNKLSDGSWVYCNQSKKTISGWQKIGGTWYWFDADDENRMVASKVQLIEGKRYAFKSSGAMATGWIKIGSDWYYASGSGALSSGWLSDGVWYYLDPADGGKMIESCVKSVDGVRYAFKSSGAMVAGWGKIGSAWYYANSSGALKSGWIKDGPWYYLDPSNGGRMAESCVMAVDGKRYAFGSSGAMVTGWGKVGSDWYYASGSGALKTGWILDGSWYYLDPSNGGRMAESCVMAVDGKSYAFNASGAMATGWIVIGSDRYCANKSGELVSGWKSHSGTTYYLDSSEGFKAVKGPKEFNGKPYYFSETSGALYVNRWAPLADGSIGWAGKTGLIEGSYPKGPSGMPILVGKDGNPLCGWITFEGVKFHAGAKVPGEIDTKWLEESGVKYWLGEDGKMATGWVSIGSSWYYFDSKGAMKTGWLKDGSAWYYLNKDGKMATGWIQLGKDWYWLDSSGVMATGWRTINGCDYYFNSSGVWQDTQSMMVSKAQGFSSSTSWLILVDTNSCYVGVFTGSHGNWSLNKYWRCSPGAPSSPTVKGEFTVQERGISFGSGYTCWYWTQFCGNYLFHSVLYNQGSMTSIQDGRLGQQLSHGCVRMEISTAKWIYDNIPRGTKVFVY